MKNKRIPLIRPYMDQSIIDRVQDVLVSGYWTEGPVTHELERSIEAYTGCRHALAVCNCTVGLEMALRCLGLGPGDEVIVPDYTYPATASCVEIVGAKIVIVDVDPSTMLIDLDQAKRAVTPDTKAIIPVSLFGNPLNHDALSAIKEEFGIFIIEDAACALGSEYKEKRTGNLADISVFSLHPRKFITTGEGGIITTNNPEWAEWMQSYKHFGMAGDMSRSGTRFVRIGGNYKLSNLQAAVGLGQMEKINQLLDRRRRLATYYAERLIGAEGITMPEVTPGGAHSFQSFCVFVENRDQIIQELSKRNIESQIGTYALHMHPAFSENPNCELKVPLKNSRGVFEHCLTLPLSHDISSEDQDLVVESLKELCT